MAGNSIGQLFRVTTCGESHGVGLMAIVDGVPPGLELTEEDLQKIWTAVSRVHQNLRLSAKNLIRLKLFLVCLRAKLLVRQLVYSFVILTKNRKITAILLRLLDRVMRTTPIHKSMVSVITVVAVVRVHVKLRCVLQRVLLLKIFSRKIWCIDSRSRHTNW